MLQKNILLDPMWIVGFTDGEGCFHVAISKNSTMKLGNHALRGFSIVQNVRDINLLSTIAEYFGCGIVKPNDKAKTKYQYLVRNQSDLTKIIIPFFDKYSLITQKYLDYLDFKQVLEIMNKGEHLTEDGLIKIRKIKSGMNRNRIIIPLL
jgi:hypothetical protein